MSQLDCVSRKQNTRVQAQQRAQQFQPAPAQLQHPSRSSESTPSSSTTAPAVMQRAVAALVLLGLCQLALARSPPSGRELLQTLGTCTSKIPHCETGRCYTATVDGALASVCERCKAGFTRANSGVQCVCPPGTFLNTDTGACTTCGQGYFCPGGNRQAKNTAPANQYGLRFSCDRATVSAAAATSAAVQNLGLTTKSSRARAHTDCVPMPGYFLIVATRAAQEARKCPKNSYSPGYSRLRTCLKCQSGLSEDPNFTGIFDASGSTTLRTDKVQVCQVPAGRYLSQNVVRDCPHSTWRSEWKESTNPLARYCFPCPKGTTTNMTASTQISDCKYALPGYNITKQWVDTQAQDINGVPGPDGIDPNTGLPTAEPEKCPKGTYFPGGLWPTTGTSCVPCPLGTTTLEVGSTSSDECMVPPGYFVHITGGTVTAPTAGVLVKCPSSFTPAASTLPQGTYRAGWVSWKDTSVRGAANAASSNPTLDGSDACTKCGDGILSAYTDLDEMLLGTPTYDPTTTDNTALLVAASSSSCYIEPGWGMTPVPLAINQWRANECAQNSYGVEARTFGLQQSPCKPCQRNMITLAAAANNYTLCINPDGFGLGTDGVAQCPQGTYTSQGSMQPCTPCPPGRTTLEQGVVFNPAYQDGPTDCVVIPGSGVIETLTGTDATDANLTVMECPVGTYSAGLQIGTTCTPCPVGFTTIEQGTAITAGASPFTVCTKCAAGFGRTDPSTTTVTCGICPSSTFQTGYSGVAGLNVTGDGEICLSCRSSFYTYVGSRGRQLAYTSTGMTFYNTTRGPEACVPRYQQLLIDAGQKFVIPDANFPVVSGVTTAAACMAAGQGQSDAGKAAFVQFAYVDTVPVSGSAPSEDIVSGTCRMLAVDVALGSTTTNVLLVKLIPSDPIAAANAIKAKSMASGLYSRLVLPSFTVGKPIGSAFSSEPECRRRCDMNSLCWGVRVDSASSCTLLTGEDELDVRSFYYNPAPGPVLAGQGW